MAEEQKIDGLPEGCKLLKLEERVPPLNSSEHFIMYAIVERIPKPKQRVQIAEFDLQDGETVANIRGISLFHLNSPRFIDKGQCEPDRTRIEERDV